MIHDVLGVTSIVICMMGFSLGLHLYLPCRTQWNKMHAVHSPLKLPLTVRDKVVQSIFKMCCCCSSVKYWLKSFESICLSIPACMSRWDQQQQQDRKCHQVCTSMQRPQSTNSKWLTSFLCVWMASVFIFRSSVIPPNNCNRKRPEKREKGLIYLAVKAVAPLCSLLLLRPCPLSGARAW